MIKLLLLLFFLISCYTISFSQETTKKFEMHYYVGPTISNVFKSDYGNTGITEKVKNSFGFNLGVLPYWKFSNFLHLRFGLGYNFRNFKYEMEGFSFYNANVLVSAKYANRIILNELQLPFHFVINVPKNGMYGFVGADFNYCLKGTFKSEVIEINSNYIISESNRKIDSQFYPTLDFGIGTHVKVGGSSDSFNLEVYFSLLSKEFTPINRSGQSLGLKAIFNSF